MKKVLNVALRIVIAFGLWLTGNLLIAQVKASGDPEAQGYTTCKARPIQDYHRDCGNQVNGQCSTMVMGEGGWYDSYHIESFCMGYSSTYDGCTPGIGTGKKMVTYGDCVPIQGGDPPACQPGPTHYSSTDIQISQCSEADAPGSHDPTLAREVTPNYRFVHNTLLAKR